MTIEIFSVRTKAITNAKTKRKEDTSAVTPLLPEIRAEGHLRWNHLPYGHYER